MLFFMFINVRFLRQMASTVSYLLEHDGVGWARGGGGLGEFPKQLLCKRIAGFQIITISGSNK